MSEKYPLQSEGARLESTLGDLQREHAVKDIAGWESGFPGLSRALDGILPGLYMLIGPPASGKSALAKQLLDQLAMHNGAPGVFFTLAETAKELRIKTLARLSGVESREIRRGSAYLLHWYGVPKRHHGTTEDLAPGWEKLQETARAAKSWLDLIYIVEWDRSSSLQRLEECLEEVRTQTGRQQIFVVIDDCQRLAARDRGLPDRLQMIAEELQELAARLKLPVLGTWPDLAVSTFHPQAWSDRLPDADAVLVLERDQERTRQLIEPNQALTLHVVKNRRGETGRLAFDFYPAVAKFVEAEGTS